MRVSGIDSFAHSAWGPLLFQFMTLSYRMKTMKKSWHVSKWERMWLARCGFQRKWSNFTRVVLICAQLISTATHRHVVALEGWASAWALATFCLWIQYHSLNISARHWRLNDWIRLLSLPRTVELPQTNQMTEMTSSTKHERQHLLPSWILSVAFLGTLTPLESAPVPCSLSIGWTAQDD